MIGQLLACLLMYPLDLSDAGLIHMMKKVTSIGVKQPIPLLVPYLCKYDFTRGTGLISYCFHVEVLVVIAYGCSIVVKCLNKKGLVQMGIHLNMKQQGLL